MSADGKKEPPPYILPGELKHTCSLSHTHTRTHTHIIIIIVVSLTTSCFCLSSVCFFLSSSLGPVEGKGDGVKVYHVHTPFTPPTSNENSASQNAPGKLTPDFSYTYWNHVSETLATLYSNTSLFNFHLPSCLPPLISFPAPLVYTSGGGSLSSGVNAGDGKKKYVSYDTALGRSSGMTTCTSCQQQVMTNITYKAGTYAWLMCLLFICCGWVCRATYKHGHIKMKGGPHHWLIIHDSSCAKSLTSLRIVCYECFYIQSFYL